MCVAESHVHTHAFHMQDPDSMDVLQGANLRSKKESTESAIPFAKSAANKFKPFSLKPDPTFKSFLMGGGGGGGGEGEGERGQDASREAQVSGGQATEGEKEAAAAGGAGRSSTLSRA